MGLSVFHGMCDKKDSTPIFHGSEVDFRDLVIGDSATISIRDADLQRCKFVNTDVREFEFTNVKWANKKKRFYNQKKGCGVTGSVTLV